jgi:hypothetical protein
MRVEKSFGVILAQEFDKPEIGIAPDPIRSRKVMRLFRTFRSAAVRAKSRYVRCAKLWTPGKRDKVTPAGHPGPHFEDLPIKVHYLLWEKLR